MWGILVRKLYGDQSLSVGDTFFDNRKVRPAGFVTILDVSPVGWVGCLFFCLGGDIVRRRLFLKTAHLATRAGMADQRGGGKVEGGMYWIGGTQS